MQCKKRYSSDWEATRWRTELDIRIAPPSLGVSAARQRHTATPSATLSATLSATSFLHYKSRARIETLTITVLFTRSNSVSCHL